MNYYDIIFAQQKAKKDSKYFNEISDAINVLAGTETTYTPAEMAPAILDAIPTETASGEMIAIDDAANYPAESVVTILEPMQEGSGDPSPDNVRPITGYTGVELTRTGKNLVEKAYVSPLSWNGLTITENVDGSIKITGKATHTVAKGLYTLSLQIESTYLFHTGGTDKANYLMVRRDGNPGIINEGQFTVRANSTYDVAIRTVANAEIDMTLFPVVSLLTNTETHSITFPQAQSPVYGGEVDWTNGVLRVTKWKDILFNSWKRNSAKAYYSYVSHTATPNQLSNLQVISDKAVTAVSSSSIGIFINPTGAARLNTNKAYDTANEMIADYGGSIEVVYELAEPIEIPLTSEVITLLKGDNNIWTDSGTSEIEYKVDLQSYIQKLINEASAKANTLSVSPPLGKNAVISTDNDEDGGDIKDEDEPAEENTEVDDLTANKEIAKEFAKTEKTKEYKGAAK